MNLKTYFRHKIKEKVKFHEVDLLGVCNNAVYFNYFEDARVKYMNDLKEKYKFKKILTGDSFFIMVHNEIDYIKPAFLDDELIVFTKISFIKKSSFGFIHEIKNVKTKEVICKGNGIVVHINKRNIKSVPLPKEFYDAVLDYEKNVDIITSVKK